MLIAIASARSGPVRGGAGWMRLVRLDQGSKIRPERAQAGTPYTFARGYDVGAASMTAAAALIGMLLVLLAALPIAA